jgi:hypothetical protein
VPPFPFLFLCLFLDFPSLGLSNPSLQVSMRLIGLCSREWNVCQLSHLFAGTHSIYLIYLISHKYFKVHILEKEFSNFKCYFFQ